MVVTVLFDIYERVTKSDTLEINTDNWVDKEPRRVSNGPNICFEVKKKRPRTKKRWLTRETKL